jgi:hypothetical protein
MADKWVDNSGYIGPDRRRRSGQKRWADRRRFDATERYPPLGALLRRLRVQLLGMYSPDDRARALQLLAGAMSEALRQHLFECAESLKHADKMLRTGPAGDLSQVDAAILEAMEKASPNGQV